MKRRSESQEQQKLVLKLRWLHPYLEFFAIPNGGKRYPGEARRMVLEGVEAGTPDLFIAEPKYPYCGFFIELKVKTDQKSKVSEKQLIKINSYRKKGYKAEIAYGADDAYGQIKKYMGEDF